MKGKLKHRWVGTEFAAFPERALKWVEYVLDEIPKSNHQFIGGVAMGAAALGTGTLEDIERAFIFTDFYNMVNCRFTNSFNSCQAKPDIS